MANNIDSMRALIIEMTEYLDQEVYPELDVIEQWRDRLESALAQQPAGVSALEVFRIAGGDTECEPNPTPERALEVLRDLRACYDEALTQQPAAPSGEAVATDPVYRAGYAAGVADSRNNECACTRTVAVAAPQKQGQAVYQIENDPDEWFDVDRAMYEGHDGSRKRILYSAAPPPPAAAEMRAPSYDALLLIAQSVCGALERAGVTDCDDPGEAIDVLREQYEADMRHEEQENPND